VTAQAVDGARTWPMLVAGEWVTTGETFSVRSPWDGRLVAEVSSGGAAQAQAAVAAAQAAMAAGLPLDERAAILERAAVSVEARADEVARLLALEVGKPVSAGRVEAARCAMTLRYSAVAARTLAGDAIPLEGHPGGRGHLGFTLRVPVGIVGAITPFNFPFNLAAHKIGPALAGGCAVVLKPADKAPLAALLLGEILIDAGLPGGWLSIVCAGRPEPVVDVLVEDPRVRVLTFTGSSAIGWTLRERAPRKRVLLELGNTTPLIVCADADLEAAADAAARTGFGFAGQSCISVQRVLVHESVAERFSELLAAAARRTLLGDPLDPATALGPMINAGARERVIATIEAAVAAGARRLAGGVGEHGHLEPTVLTNVPRDSEVYRREIFGPVVSVTSVDSLEEAIHLANETEYGLQAGIYTLDVTSALRAAARLDFGGVTINESPSYRLDQMPYGGIKESGNTREGPLYAVREMTEERLVILNGAG
jgi:acyl-CoA reductase-like NAD-dependent aldehyde dehydrogenase